MKPTDRALLIAIAALLVLMAILVLNPGAPTAGTNLDSDLAGEPRDVDVDLLRRRLIRGELSDQEALYYR